MAGLHTLTVQDILWINLQATRRVNHFNHAKLEEATFYQFAYGGGEGLVERAARFLRGFVRMRPLDRGVEATAFLAVAAFLEINGAPLRLKDADAAAWFREASVSADAAGAALAGVATPETSVQAHPKPDVRAAVRAVMGCYPATLAALV